LIIDEDKNYVVDFENNHGICGSVAMAKERYDEDDVHDLMDSVTRVIEAWMKRREFVYNHIEHYKLLC